MRTYADHSLGSIMKTISSNARILIVLSIGFFSSAQGRFIPSAFAEDANPAIPELQVSEGLAKPSKAPKYQTLAPEWGVQLSFSPNALGGIALTQSQKDKPAFAFSLSADYQPTFIQKFGILGIGPIIEAFPIFDTSITNNPFSLLAAGGQIRYQARYFREQPVVPVAAYSVEYMKYQFNSGESGTLVAKGPSFGLWILLNVLEPDSAAQFYVNTGVLRSYLILEYKSLSGSDGTISFSGGSYYFGLRCEF